MARTVLKMDVKTLYRHRQVEHLIAGPGEGAGVQAVELRRRGGEVLVGAERVEVVRAGLRLHAVVARRIRGEVDRRADSVWRELQELEGNARPHPVEQTAAQRDGRGERD